ncbi:hypothetical protein ACR6C2_13960 [Streptomyces sp. INA 01156]
MQRLLQPLGGRCPQPHRLPGVDQQRQGQPAFLGGALQRQPDPLLGRGLGGALLVQHLPVE